DFGRPRKPRLATPSRFNVEAIDYRTLADLRYQIRRFLRVRETAARRAGGAPQQYLVLLQLRGLDGEAPVASGALAERLHLHHHSAVELVDRLVAGGLVTRKKAPRGRRVFVEVTPRGDRVLRTLARHSLDELQKTGPELVRTVTRLMRSARRESGADSRAGS